MNLLPIQHASIRDEALAILSRLGAPDTALACEGLAVSSPITGELITHLAITGSDDAGETIWWGEGDLRRPRGRL